MQKTKEQQLVEAIDALRLSNHEFQDNVLALLRSLEKSNDLAVTGRSPFRKTVMISATTPVVLDYRDRKFVFIYSANSLTLTLEDLGTIALAANAWVNISFQPGMFIYAQSQVANVPVFICCTDDKPN